MPTSTSNSANAIPARMRRRCARSGDLRSRAPPPEFRAAPFARETFLALGLLFRKSTILPDCIFSHVRPENLRNCYRTVRLLVIFYNLANHARHRERGIVQRVHVTQRAALIAVSDIESTRLKIVEI